jgi:hypothetical protein
MLKRFVFILLPFVLFSFSSKTEDLLLAEKWIALFNGKDLKGWLPKINGYPLNENFGSTFRVKDGILMIRYDQYSSFDEKFGALFYDKEFKNYRLRAEYRFVGETFTKGGPSWGYKDNGIQYYCQNPRSIKVNQLFPVCLEYNFHGGNGKDERPTGEICTLGTSVEIKGKKNQQTCTPADIKRTIHGEQWATVEIDVKDGKISQWVNGEKIMEFENPNYDPKNENAKELMGSGDGSIKSGFISLQSNSHPIDFRKIEIMEYK